MKAAPGARSRGRALLYLLLPLPLLLIPTPWLEAHPLPCLFRALLGVRCPGCGLSRAASCAVHGRFGDAWRYNPLIVVVLPLLAYEWLRLVVGAWRAQADGGGAERGVWSRGVV